MFLLTWKTYVIYNCVHKYDILAHTLVIYPGSKESYPIMLPSPASCKDGSPFSGNFPAEIISP